MDPFADRMAVVGYLAERLDTVNSEAGKMSIEHAIRLLLDSVGQIIHPDDLLYMKPKGIA